MSVERLSLVLNASKARGTDKVVLIGIANHDGDGGAWPSLATLARYANVDERTVRRSIANLVALGELAVEVNAGGSPDTRSDRRPNLYRILLDGRTPMSPRTSDGGTPTSERGDARVTHGGTPTSPEPSIEPSIEPSPPIVPLAEVFGSADFDEFWSAYPRKAGKRTARAAWDRAITRARQDVILAGARRYRDDPNREDAYTAHAATWLNRDGWEDDPLPARGRASATALYLDAATELAPLPSWYEPPALEA